MIKHQVHLLALLAAFGWAAPSHAQNAQAGGPPPIPPPVLAPVPGPPVAPPPAQPQPPSPWTPPPPAFPGGPPGPPGGQPGMPAFHPPPLAPPGTVAMPPGFLEAPGLWPRTLPFDEGVSPPPGYHVGAEPLRGMWIAGLIVFASTYGVSLLAGAAVASSTDGESWLLAIPVAGPAAFALKVEDGSDGRPLLGALSLVSLGQATGVALLIAGLAVNRDVYHRNDVTVSERAPETRLSVGPTSFAVIREF